VGVRAVAATGRPINLLAADDLGERFFLLPRGAGGRLGLVTTTNLHIATTLPRGIELIADVFNLFDQDRPTSVDEVYLGYRTEGLLPIIGGSQEDLVFLREQRGGDEVPVHRSPSYGLPLSRQPPLTAAIGVRARF